MAETNNLSIYPSDDVGATFCEGFSRQGSHWRLSATPNLLTAHTVKNLLSLRLSLPIVDNYRP